MNLERILMANVDEVRKKLAYAKSFLEPYRSMGELVGSTIDDISKIEEMTNTPSKENASKCLQILEQIEARVAPYASYVPELYIALAYVKDELKKT
jgi:hypothetical protein